MDVDPNDCISVLPGIEGYNDCGVQAVFTGSCVAVPSDTGTLARPA